MSRSQRLLALLQALRRHRRPVAARTLARELSVSVRTVYRDIETLARQGAAISGEAGIGYILRPGFTLPPLMFSEDEIEALVLGARWVAQQPDEGLQRSARDVVAKVEAVLPPRLRARVEDASLFAVPRAAVAADCVDLGLLRSALREERKLRVTYANAEGRETERTVWPVALSFFEQVRVLVAWCELRQAYRHFRTDRIRSAVRLAEPLPRPRRALLADWWELEGLGGADI
jgi:predicted DNA-binding transcriptional regulator YafY